MFILPVFVFKKIRLQNDIVLAPVLLKEQTKQRRFGLRKLKKQNPCRSSSVALQLIARGWEDDQKKKKKKKMTTTEDRGAPVGGVTPGREVSALRA